jgi:calcineurin-like phosphoesterase family protein
MAIFFTADTHFDHDMILKYANRPWARMVKDWRDRAQVESAKEAMNASLIENWNKVVTNSSDRVFVIGDFAWSRHAYFLNACKGKKTLIIGSHDRVNNDVLRNFTEFMKEKEIRVGDISMVLHHTCLRLWERCHYGSVHLFGHSHGRLTTFNMSFDVGVDTELAKYSPVPLEAVIKEVDRRRGMMQDAGRIVGTNDKILYRQDDVAWVTMNKVKQDEFTATGEMMLPDYADDL